MYFNKVSDYSYTKFISFQSIFVRIDFWVTDVHMFRFPQQAACSSVVVVHIYQNVMLQLRSIQHYIRNANLASHMFIQGDTKKRKLLKCVVAAMYGRQHCGTGTLSYRQPFGLLSLKRQVIMVQFLSNFFCWISSIFVGFFKSSHFFFVSPCVTGLINKSVPR